MVFIIGIAAGILGGMGIGGGTILIPALTLIMHVEQHIAQSVNLISFIPASIVALIYHFKNNNIKKEIIKYIVLSGLAGAIIGSLIAIRTKPLFLRKIFGIFLFIMGSIEIFSSNRQD